MTSAAVNAYLHAHTQAPASAKVFRTWGATVVAVAVLAGAEPPADVSARSRERLAIGAAATLLGDTASVTRSSYIHPAWIDVGRSDLVAAAVAESSDRIGTRAVASLLPIQGSKQRSFLESPMRPRTLSLETRIGVPRCPEVLVDGGLDGRDVGVTGVVYDDVQSAEVAAGVPDR